MAKTDRKKQFWNNTEYVLFALIWVFASTIVTQIIVGRLMAWPLGTKINEPVWSGVYSVLSYGGALGLTLFGLPKIWKKWKTSREELGLNGLPTWTDIGLAPIAYIVSTLLALGAVALFSLLPWFDAEQAQDVGFSVLLGGGERIIAFLVLVVLAPIMEEIIFRGWLYGKLRTKMGMFSAILLTSLLFGIMHFQWNVGVNVFCFSVVVCGMREFTGTIYAGILTHMLKNGVAFFLLYVL